ncbi:MAG TPA: hypothetical protein VD886_23390 [Herpetosiphonaceae bacterium]|nr:hypothetical protein [Herpetosiphonaceae bacterium]
MKIYWSLKSIPELNGLSKLQQRLLWRMAVRADPPPPRVQMARLVLLVMLLIAFLIPSRVAGFPDHMLSVMAWGGFWGLAGQWLFRQISIPALRPLLAMYRQVIEPRPDRDDTYYVPPAF